MIGVWVTMRSNRFSEYTKILKVLLELVVNTMRNLSIQDSFQPSISDNTDYFTTMRNKSELNTV